MIKDDELESYRVVFEDFEIEKKLGEGAFGEVFKAVHKNTQTAVAIKKLFCSKLKGDSFVLFEREVHILASCRNPFCLPFLGYSSSNPYVIVTKFYERSLLNALRSKENPLKPTDKSIIALGVALGMSHLHSLQVIHRDLKSANVLLNKYNVPAICDFGLARLMNDETSSMTREVGTCHWSAPEVLESHSYTNKIDVYSYGILLWELLCQSIPYKGLTPIQVAFAVVQKKERPPIPKDTPKPLKKLIEKCWDQDPSKRPEFEFIAELFIKHKVLFPKTDKDIFNEFLNFAHKRMKKQSNTSSKGLNSKEQPQQKPDQELSPKHSTKHKDDSGTASSTTSTGKLPIINKSKSLTKKDDK